MKVFILLLIIGFIGIQTAYAQTIELVEGINLETDQVIVILVLGVLAGITRAFINKQTKPSTSTTGTDTPKAEPEKNQFFKNIITCVLATIPLGFTAAMSVDINLFGYIVIFFASYGGGAAIQNGGIAVAKMGR